MESINNNVALEPDHSLENSQDDLTKFTKRYSKAGRKNIADEIRELRFQHFKKQKSNPERQSSKENQENQIDGLEKERDTEEKEIENLENEVAIQKSKLMYKLTTFFKKTELEKELQIDPKKKKVEQLKKDIEERVKIIEEIDSVITDSSSLEEARKVLALFYREQGQLKDRFEDESDIRDVEMSSRKNGQFFVHGIPTKGRAMQNTSMNNPTTNVQGMTPEEKLSLLIGLEPTISASLIKEGQKDSRTYYSFGVILGGGKVLSAYKDDASTLAEGLYSRRSKSDETTQNTSIQPNIERNLDKAVNDPVESRFGEKYNEVVVEKPKVAGLYINLSQLDQNFDNVEVDELKKYSRELNLPVYALKGGVFYRFNIDKMKISEEEQATLSIDTILDSRREFSQEERIDLANLILQKNLFTVQNKEDMRIYSKFKNGAGFNYGGENGYKKLQKDQANHQTKVRDGMTQGDAETVGGFINKISVLLEENLKNIENAESEKHSKYFRQNLRENLILLYGFALDAQSSGDMDTYEKTKDLINKYGSFDQCAEFIAKRIDENGNYKILDADVPIEIRQQGVN